MVKKQKVKISKLERRNYKWIYLFLLPSLLIFLIFYLQPIITVFYTSLTKWDGFNTPVFIGLKNYMDMFTNDAFRISLKNILVPDRRNASCRIRRFGCVHPVSQTKGMEIHSCSIYGA